MKNKYLIPVLILLVYTCNVFAQSDVKNTGILYIGSATDTFFVAASFTNASGAALTNNGILLVRSGLVNDQTGMSAGTGKLYLNGSSTQTVGGSQTFKTFNFFSNNPAGITLNNDLSVSGIHTFLAGMINTSSTPNYMVYEAGSSYTGDGDNKHINGWVKKIGSTDFVFPVGNEAYERTVSLTSLTASGEFNVKHNRAKTSNYTNLFDPLVLVDTAEYWTINKISGVAAKLTMNWDRSKVPFPLLMLSDIRATYYDGAFWKSIGGSATGNVLTVGSIMSTSVSAFNANFTIGSISHVLALQILGFNATHSNNLTKINWTVGNELNVTRYELQRSNDGINFTTIASKYPFNQNNTALYNYDDQLPVQGTAFYRLRITSNNSQVIFSNTIMVSAAAGSSNFYVVKNPVGNGIEIFAGASFKGHYNYTIINNAGQLIQSGTLDIKYAGQQNIPFQSDLSRGIYFLVVRNTEHLLQKSILKE